MNDDIYLSIATNLYETKVWDENAFKNNVLNHAKEKNIDLNAINAFINRVLEKDITIENKEELKNEDSSLVVSQVETPTIEVSTNTDTEITINNDVEEMPSASEVVVEDETNPITFEFQSEEEYESLSKNMGKIEDDSNVLKLNSSKERIDSLIGNKMPLINRFLKGGIVITASNLLKTKDTDNSLSYMDFVDKIKNGTFNARGHFEEAVSDVVRKIMSIEEREKVR